jgi:hypothetical protein
MLKKIKLFKKILKLSKEIKKMAKENEEALLELRQLFETAKILFPKLGGILEDIIRLAKGNSN